jgi:hypothetical protein
MYVTLRGDGVGMTYIASLPAVRPGSRPECALRVPGACRSRPGSGLVSQIVGAQASYKIQFAPRSAGTVLGQNSSKMAGDRAWPCASVPSLNCNLLQDITALQMRPRL